MLGLVVSIEHLFNQPYKIQFINKQIKQRKQMTEPTRKKIYSCSVKYIILSLNKFSSMSIADVLYAKHTYRFP